MDVARIVRTQITSGRKHELDAIIDGISNGQATLLDVVKALGEFLTSEDASQRTKGVELLSDVVVGCPPERINRQSARVLNVFFCEKLDDVDVIIPALKGLLPLTSIPSYTDTDALETFQAVSKHVRMKAHVQSTRQIVFRIIDSLVAHHRSALKSISSTFLPAYIELADGEKDPRNLLVAFSIDRVLLIEFDVKPYIAEMFDITFCYFPISFNPPPGDTSGITSDMLRTALRGCLAANPQFALLALPPIIEKLGVGGASMKRDCLQTLTAALPIYGTDAARKFGAELWSSFKLEIFQPTDSETAAEALKATQALILTASGASAHVSSLPTPVEGNPQSNPQTTSLHPAKETDSDEAGPHATKDVAMVDAIAEENKSDQTEAIGGAKQWQFEGLAKTICEECIDILREPEKSRAQPAVKVLCAFVGAEASIRRATLERAITHLMGLFLNPEEITLRSAVLSALGTILSAVTEVFLPSKNPKELGGSSASSTTIKSAAWTLANTNAYVLERPLDKFKDELLGAFTVGLRESSTQTAALGGLSQLVRIPALLSNEELGFVVHNVNEVLMRHDGEVEETRTTILNLLTSISSITPRPLEETTLPLLFAALPDQAPTKDNPSRDQCRSILSALRTLCVSAPLFETLVIRLSAKLDILCTHKEGNASDQAAGEEDARNSNEDTALYAHSILLTLAQVLEVKVGASHPDVPKYVDRLLPSLFRLFIGAALNNEHARTTARDPRLLTDASKVVSLIVLSLPIERQKSYIAALFSAFREGEVKAVSGDLGKFPEGVSFRPFENGASEAQKNLIQLFSVSISALHKEVKLPISNSSAFLQELLAWSLEQASTNQQREAVQWIVASELNKQAENHNTFLADSLPSFWDTEIARSGGTLERRLNAIAAWVWITKALLIRNHPVAMSNVDKLFSLFDDEALSWHAAKAIGEIGSGGGEVLTKKNFAVLRLLFAQKFFSSVVPRIVKGYDATTDARHQTACLVCLASLIKSMPKATYLQEIPVLLPLLLRGLDLPDVAMRTNVIEALLTIAPDQADALSEHAVTLVNAMLKNARPQEFTSPMLRVAALKCLSIFPSTIRYDILHPVKSTVMRELGKAVDDPRRVVRKEAVDTRGKWYAYNG